MRIGIFFGGRSREREISFAGGRTVYDLLDKSLFTAVPIFVDSLGNFILLDWQYLYKGSIRDFYPPVAYLQEDAQGFQAYIESLGKLNPDKLDDIMGEVGLPLLPNQFADHFDFAFLALHGPYGEDGSIQGLLDFYEIPYSGSGILPSAIGINKAVQKRFMKTLNANAAASVDISRHNWLDIPGQKELFFKAAKEKFSLPVVIKSSSQGSSIGVSVLREWDIESFNESINKSFFIQTVSAAEWKALDAEGKKLFVARLCDIYEGIGVPFRFTIGDENLASNVEHAILYHPVDVFGLLSQHFEKQTDSITFHSTHTESGVLVEEFIRGQEFSCIVVEGEHGEPIALPPTGIIKSEDIFNYRAKYLPGISRKVTPINLPEARIKNIISACESLYTDLGFDVYARIDGMINDDGTIYLNDPNTTSGMLPSSFFFHQAAEIGLSPSQFLTYIIHKSLQKRRDSSHHAYAVVQLLDKLNVSLAEQQKSIAEKWKIAVILGGTSTERHISVESGRNVFEKLSSSGKYKAIPVFLDENENDIQLFILPLNLLLKDNADDIREKARHYETAPIIKEIIKKAGYITRKFASGDYEFYPREIKLEELKNKVDSVFIALHGRPGEDGSLQKLLEPLNIPYNGSGIESSGITINKFITNELLKQHGFLIPAHVLVKKAEWIAGKEAVLNNIEAHLPYPLIAKPADDGCSSAVKKISNRAELMEFTGAMFRDTPALNPEMRIGLSLQANEEFPQKDFFVIEELVSPKGAKHFIEVTGGMLTSKGPGGSIQYEVFEPSEALASKGILSLEEKFLAGEGQNITPARFSADKETNQSISSTVRDTLERAAKALNIEGYCRIDAFVRIFEGGKAEVIFIEVNSLPGLTPATCIFHQAALNGYKPFQFLDHIIKYGAQKNKRRQEEAEGANTARP
jgi:UDP-N-acetylmuramate--alanine ligase